MHSALRLLSQVTPLFDLERYVAVNPLMGQTSKSFRAAVESWSRTTPARVDFGSAFSQHHAVERPGRSIDQILGYFLSSYYDRGTAIVPSPWKSLPLLEAWIASLPSSAPLPRTDAQSLATIARSIPKRPLDAIDVLIDRSNVENPKSELLLVKAIALLPGWTSYLRQKEWPNPISENSDAVALLAMILCCHVGCGPYIDLEVEEISTTDTWWNSIESSERSQRRTIAAKLRPSSPPQVELPLVKAAFCIDVRSERLRRHWESVAPWVETDGCAGFFSAPLSWTNEEESAVELLAPVLIEPTIRLKASVDRKSTKGPSFDKTMKAALAGPQGLAQVESLGFYYGARFLFRLPSKKPKARYRGLETIARSVSTETKAAVVSNLLRSLSWKGPWPEAVLLVGHESTSVNNPHASSLDCGACGGRGGEANARTCAAWANQDDVRERLRNQGYSIPHTTRFFAAVHDTAFDRVRFFWTDDVDRTLRDRIERSMAQACVSAREERNLDFSILTKGPKPSPVSSAETRPEGALVSNRAFVVAPREWVSKVEFRGSTFLHSYDSDLDPDGQVLESILTAPVVVAQWINAQYWFSSVFPRQFAAGDKSLHSAVGGFGVLEGTDLDLKVGLPLQSLFSDDRRLHEPLRLQVFVAADQRIVDRILDSHPSVRNLFDNEWMFLIRIEDDRFWFRKNGTWELFYDSDGER